ncbi:hypothetical protein DID75_02795 [Candidatus Marinamargulisbacteria bacterium SCGC AG-410-N11]|nr:hypothetical protein DID75_02795 [Candidatus Marinamargulisbacteria bacterium SCGC AG-410-N11]
MSEGTKLGEYQTSKSDFDSSQSTESTIGQSGATKMGDLSGFDPELSKQLSDITENDFSDSNDEGNKELSTENMDTNSIVKKDDVQTEAVNKTASEKTEPNFEDALETTFVDFQEGDVVEGVVRKVEKFGVLIDFNYKSDGFISTQNFSLDYKSDDFNNVNIGDTIKATIEKLESKEGYIILSRKKFEIEEAWEILRNSLDNNETILVDIISKVQGGLVASYKSLKGFIPASQVIKHREDDLSTYVGQSLDVCLLQVDRRRKKIIFSHKAHCEREKGGVISKFDSIDVGEVYSGKVTSIKDFGVFVDIGGLEGLVHISELSWSRVRHPSDIVSVGDSVQVFILGVDKDSRKVSLGMKQLLEDPWVTVGEKYKLGQVIEGEITRIVPFGAFMHIDNGLEGLIHISELTLNHVTKVEDVVNVGDKVEVKIIKLQPEEQKIGLSLRQSSEEGSAENEQSVDVKEGTEVSTSSESQIDSELDSISVEQEDNSEIVGQETDVSLEDNNSAKETTLNDTQESEKTDESVDHSITEGDNPTS